MSKKPKAESNFEIIAKAQLDILKANNQSAADTLNQFADVTKDIGELSLSMSALYLTLCDLIPGFGSSFVRNLEGSKCRQIKNEFERKIRVLREGSREISEGRIV
jgi:hypothetical protein